MWKWFLVIGVSIIGSFAVIYAAIGFGAFYYSMRVPSGSPLNEAIALQAEKVGFWAYMLILVSLRTTYDLKGSPLFRLILFGVIPITVFWFRTWLPSFESFEWTLQIIAGLALYHRFTANGKMRRSNFPIHRKWHG